MIGNKNFTQAIANIFTPEADAVSSSLALAYLRDNVQANNLEHLRCFAHDLYGIVAILNTDTKYPENWYLPCAVSLIEEPLSSILKQDSALLQRFAMEDTCAVPELTLEECYTVIGFALHMINAQTVGLGIEAMINDICNQLCVTEDKLKEVDGDYFWNLMTYTPKPFNQMVEEEEDEDEEEDDEDTPDEVIRQIWYKNSKPEVLERLAEEISRGVGVEPASEESTVDYIERCYNDLGYDMVQLGELVDRVEDEFEDETVEAEQIESTRETFLRNFVPNILVHAPDIKPMTVYGFRNERITEMTNGNALPIMDEGFPILVRQSIAMALNVAPEKVVVIAALYELKFYIMDTSEYIDL